MQKVCLYQIFKTLPGKFTGEPANGIISELESQDNFFLENDFSQRCDIILYLDLFKIDEFGTNTSPIQAIP